MVLHVVRDLKRIKRGNSLPRRLGSSGRFRHSLYMSKLTNRFTSGLRKVAKAPVDDAKALRAALEKAQHDAVVSENVVSNGQAAGIDARRKAELVAEDAGSAARAANRDDDGKSVEIGGPKGLEPTRYGDWEKAGRCIDF
jgi:hypothetical protein